MIPHLRTIAWLQFRLIKNSATRSLRWLGALAWGMQVVFAAMGCAFLTSMAFAIGFITLDEDAVWLLVPILDGTLILILLIRTIMLSVDLTEADFIDTGKLLFLPIRLRTLFAINYVVRNVSGIVLLILPPIFGLCLSLAIIHGPRMLLGIPLGFVSLLAIVTWFGFIREWLLTLNENRKRSLLTATILLISLGIGAAGLGGAYAAIRAERQSPQAVSQEKLDAMQENDDLQTVAVQTGIEIEPLVRDALISGNAWIPLGWFPLGMYRMIGHQYGVALLGGLGLTLIALLGIALEYRLVVARYRSASGGSGAAEKTNAQPKSKWTQLTLPKISREWSAYVGLAYLVRSRSLTFKATHWFYGIVAVIASLTPFIIDVSALRGQWWNGFIPFGFAALILFFSAALSNNIFAYDRTGFQVLVLMPAKRSNYLLTKNGITIAFVLLWTGMVMIPCVLIFRPHPLAVAAAFAITLQAQLMLSVIGNGLSIALPFRMKEGQLDQPAQPLAAMLPSFLLLIAMPIVFAPMAITAVTNLVVSWLTEIEGAWISLPIALAFLAATLCIYAASIPTMAAFLASREMKMLEVLASDRE